MKARPDLLAAFGQGPAGLPLPADDIAADDIASVTISTSPGRDQLDTWDDLVRAQPAADVAQLSGWAGLRSQAGFTAVHLLLEDHGRLLGGAQVLVRTFRGLGSVGYVPYGPLVATAAPSPSVVRDALARALAELGRRHLRALFVQPPREEELTSRALLALGFRPTDVHVAPAASLRIDLDLDEAELRRNLSRRLRTWANNWESRGVSTRLGGEDDLPLLAHLLADTAEYQGFTPFGTDYLTRMYRELAPAGHLTIFIGEVDGIPAAMDVLTGCGDTIKVRLVGMDRTSDSNRLNVPGAIRWAAIRWAKQAGYRWFDFGGLHETSMQALETGNPIDAEALEGPDRYKMRFGGTPYRYPRPVELISAPLLRMSYDVVRRSALGKRLVNHTARATRAETNARAGTPPRRY